MQQGILLLLFMLPSALFRSLKGVLFGLLALLWINQMIAERRTIVKRPPFDLPLILFALWIPVALIGALDRIYSAGEYAKFLLEVFTFYLIATFVQTEKQMNRVISSLMILTAVVSGYGVAKFFLWESGSLLNRSVRATSLTPEFHWLSLYFVLVIPFLLCYTMAEECGRRKIGYALFALSLFCLFLTYTRSAWIAVWVECFLYIALKKRRWLIPFLVMGVLSVALFFYLPKVGFQMDTTDPQTFQIRANAWDKVIHDVSLYQPFGVGFGRKPLFKIYPNGDIGDPRENVPHPHNLYLEMLLTVGWPGLLLLLWFFWKIMRCLWLKVRSPHSAQTTLSLSLLMMMTGYLVYNLFDHTMVGGMAHLFWFLVALVPSESGKPG